MMTARFTLLIVSVFFLLSFSAHGSQRDIHPKLPSDSCAKFDLASASDAEQASAIVTQCSYRFVARLLTTLDAIVSSGNGTSRDQPAEKIRVFHPDILELFRNYEWVFSSMRTNLEVLNSFDDIEIIPSSIFNWIVEELIPLYLEPMSQKTDYALLFCYMLGGDFSTHDKNGNAQTVTLPGLLTFIKDFDLQRWSMARSLQDQLVSMAATRIHSKEPARSWLTVVKNYFTYMPVQNRLHLLIQQANLIADPALHEIFLKKFIEDDGKAEEAAQIYLSQHAGPFFGKILQTMQSMTKERSSITPILVGVNQWRSIPLSLAKDKIWNEFMILMDPKVSFKLFIDKKPTNVSSFAQVHKITHNGQNFLAKVRRDKIVKIVEREQESVKKILRDKSTEIDGNATKDIATSLEDLSDNLNLGRERLNLRAAALAYNDSQQKISVIGIPPAFAHAKGSDVLLTNVIKGTSIGEILESNSVEDQKKALSALQTLYEKFLRVALDPNQSIDFLFCHGDLRQDNIFIDVDSSYIYLTDFSTAALIEAKTSQKIISNFNEVKTNDPLLRSRESLVFHRSKANMERIMENFIASLQKSLPEFSLEKDASVILESVIADIKRPKPVRNAK